MKKIIIAIDGHSSCGKSTMAKDLAKAIGYTYVDSGAMYRAVTLYAIRNNIFEGETLNLEMLKEHLPNIHISFKKNEETGRSETYLNGENVEKEIRGMEVANLVSPIAAVGFVREEMVKQQQAMGVEKGIVMDGRDIGTMVFPDAELKIFVTASAEVRAQRRLDELSGKDDKVSFQSVLENLQKRDYIDSTRKDGPLKKADDALVLDNSNISIQEQNEWLLNEFRKRV
ncbi:(d)CMP kinase [Bacteroidales bacterium OttesenSCG-928-I14]|nr:(d)CMP kinase [Bacteroidales bacterium OttesenSCG-928-I14]